ncbi:hypothetical protein M1N06_02160 [Peptococcaceae bacterium]|nr:hypothetical protein [Peptococcaceae bacterium]
MTGATMLALMIIRQCKIVVGKDKKHPFLIKLTKSHKKGEKKINFQAELARLREKKTLLEGKNYYIPHQNLLKVKKHLEKKEYLCSTW